MARYFVEPHTTAARGAIAGAAGLASSYAAYPESRAAFARLRRDGRLEPPDYLKAVTDLTADWQNVERLELDQDVAAFAGLMAERHTLRGFDAVHLASAVTLGQASGGVVFLTYDAALNRAAQAEGLALWTP